MLKSIEGNFDHPEVYELLKKHFIELRAASPEGSAHVLDVPGLKIPSIKFWSLWKNDELIGCGALKFLEDGHGVGDSVDVLDIQGVVEKVGLRVTTVRDKKGTLWYLRNGEILKVGNQSQSG